MASGGSSRIAGAFQRVTFGFSRRLVFVFGSLLCFFVAGALFINLQTQKEFLQKRLDERIHFLGKLVTDVSLSYLYNMRLADLEIILEDVNRQADVDYVYLIDEAGLRLASGSLEDDQGFLTAQADPIAEMARDHRMVVHRRQDGVEVAAFPIVLGDDYLGTLRFGINLGQYDSDLRKVQNRNLLAGAVFVIIGILLCILVAQRLTRPLAHMISITRSAADGDLDQHVELYTNDELEQLASSFNSMMDALRRSMNHAHFLAYRDKLTGLPNRAWFTEHFEESVDFHVLKDRPVAVLFLDIDRFKHVNDTQGHLVGDQLLRAFAERLVTAVEASIGARIQTVDLKSKKMDADPKKPSVCRLGGDEFIVLLPLKDGVSEAAAVARAIIGMLKTPFDLATGAHITTTSIGIAVLPGHGTTTMSLLKNADAAMYQAKSAGRNRFKLFDAEIARRELDRLNVENELKAALKEEALSVFFQPQFSVDSGRLVGAEALVRWHHPTRGLLGPADFIPIAEAAGLMPEVGRQVFRKALTLACDWPVASDGSPLRLAVNSSIQELEDEEYVDCIFDFLKSTGFAAERLEIEVTEGTAMVDSDVIEQKLAMLRFAGIKFAVDDFGIGYSNLARLKHLDFEVLKIDQSLMRDVGVDQNAETLVSTILNMCKALNLEVTAEGIENLPQLEFLKARGCDFAQGYSLARPMHAEAFVSYAKSSLGGETGNRTKRQAS